MQVTEEPVLPGNNTGAGRPGAAPVRENCLNCHTPHGSNQASLLVTPIPFLCQQCHSSTRHPSARP